MEFHPEILAEFERLFFMAAGADTMKAEPLKQGDKNPFREFVLAGAIQKLSKLLPLVNLFLRERPRGSARRMRWSFRCQCFANNIVLIRPDMQSVLGA